MRTRRHWFRHLCFLCGVSLALSALPLRAIAQYDDEEAYDPFADYSEFDEGTDEEADINFFRNGRFFSIGAGGGLRAFTGNMGKTYAAGPSYGLFLSYFFDLRSAVQLGFLTGDHAFEFSHPIETITGNVSFTLLNVDYKYFLSSQNVSRGFADLNPYIVGGLSQIYRTTSITGDSSGQGGRDSAMGISFGGGLEIPITRKKSFFGIQATYRFFTFPDENKYVYLPVSGETSTTKLNGDSYDIIFLLGSNF